MFPADNNPVKQDSHVGEAESEGDHDQEVEVISDEDMQALQDLAEKVISDEEMQALQDLAEKYPVNPPPNWLPPEDLQCDAKPSVLCEATDSASELETLASDIDVDAVEVLAEQVHASHGTFDAAQHRKVKAAKKTAKKNSKEKNPKNNSKVKKTKQKAKK